MAQHFDVASKLLVGRPVSALFPPLFGDQVVHWLNVELPRVENKRADLVAETASGEIAYLEIDSRNEAKLPRKMCAKYMHIEDRFPGKVVKPVLFYIGRERMRHKKPYQSGRVTFDYELIDIRDLDGDRLLRAADVEDNMLALLTSKADKERVMLTVLGKLAKMKGTKRDDLAMRFIILGGLRDAEDEIIERVRTMVTLTDLLENKVLGPVLRERFAAGKRTGEKRGERKGELRGRAEGERLGREEGERKVLLLQLERRFGPLSKSAKRRISAANEEQITRWAVDLLSASSAEELLR